MSVLAVLDEDEQTLINVNIVDKEKVRYVSKVVNISLNSLIPDSFLPSGHSRVENSSCYVEVPPLHNNCHLFFRIMVVLMNTYWIRTLIWKILGDKPSEEQTPENFSAFDIFMGLTFSHYEYFLYYVHISLGILYASKLVKF